MDEKGVRRASSQRHGSRAAPCQIANGHACAARGVTSAVGPLQGSTSEPASDAEMVEYCRDDESVGCDIDMLTRLVQQLAASKATSHAKVAKVQWSLGIDEAVQNMQPQM